MAGPDEILAYWIHKVGEKNWYKGGDALDADIRTEFEADWNRATAGACSLWLTYPTGALAYIILTDQFPRNMFRGTGKAFESDMLALTAAKKAIAKGWDMKIDGAARQFFYMPLMHSECLGDQDRCVRLMKERMADGGASLLHARAHREVIRLFGRFPTRNAALDRNTTLPEKEFVEDGGYRKALEAVGAA